MEEEVKLNLYQKIQAVSMDVMNISKDMTVGYGNSSYKAVSDSSLTLKIKKSEAKHKITSIPLKQDIIHQECIRTLTSENKESIKYSFIIKMTTRFIDLENTNDFIDVDSFGHGLDSGDKGFGKASTYARKYALLNAYKIATGEDPDSIPSKQDSSKKQEPLRDKVINYMERDTEYKIQIFTHYSVGNYSELTDSQIGSIAKSIQKKGGDI